MASAHDESANTVVTGFNLKVRMVAPWKGSFDEPCPFIIGLEGVVDGGVGGNKLFAASQSSSTNYGSVRQDDMLLSGY